MTLKFWEKKKIIILLTLWCDVGLTHLEMQVPGCSPLVT